MTKKFSIIFIFLALVSISFPSFSNGYIQFNLYLTDEDKFRLWGSVYNSGKNAVTDESPDELIYNYTCLFLSINEENLTFSKGAFSRYKKNSEEQFQQRVDYLSSKSFDMSNCSLN